MASYRDYDKNEPRSYQVIIPRQETGYNKTKEECCNVVIDSFSFIKRLPAASSFLLVLTTLVSITSCYFGRELVLNRKRNQDKQKHVSTLPTNSHLESQLVSYSTKETSPSAHRSDEDNSHDNHHTLPRARKFSHSASPHHSLREPRPVPHPPHSAPLGPASSNFIPSSHAPTAHEHMSRPTLHAPSTQHWHSISASNHHDPTVEHRNRQVAVVQESLQAHSSVAAAARRDYDYEDMVTVAAECLHAQDYGQMRKVLSDIPIDSAAVEKELALAVTFGLGQANFKMKHYSQAKTYFIEVVARARAVGERGRGDISIANYYLGELLFIRSKFDEASRQYKEAIDFHSSRVIVARIFKIIPPTKSGLWSKLAAALRNGSRVMDAISAYREAIAAGTAKKDQLSAHTSLGNLLQNVGDNSQAVEHYTASISLSEELGDTVSLGWAHGNIGNAYLGLNHRDKAIHHLKMALELTLEHEPTPSAIGRAYNNLGTAYQALNELDQAQEYYDLSLAQAIYGGDQAGQARVYGNIGNLQMLQKKYDGSIAHYTETLSTTKDKTTKITAHHNRGIARYEKAESEKRKHYVTKFISPSSGLSAITSSPASAEREAEKLYTFTFHGDIVERSLESEHKLPTLPITIKKRYQKAMEDLSLVVQQHEQSFKHIKGSRSGLTLSVSLFETNSRTFHRLLDCHYNVGEWEKALVFAEQSRARTLGELLLERKRGQLEVEFDTPLDLEDIDVIVGSQSLDVVMISYTGSRLLVWVLSPGEGEAGLSRRREVRKGMFQVTLEEKGFEDKSLEYYLHYLLSEELVEKNVEMYAYIDYQTNELVSPIVRLHELFAKPLLRMLSCLHPNPTPGQVRDVIVIPDSYLNLLPLAALFNQTAEEFLGDRYRFRIMPSLLSMGVLNQMPPVVVHIPQEGSKFCVVGNPTIPTFEIKGKTWSLGKLPFATEEAEWVSYILGCKPTLHEQATKSVVMMMVSSARMIHIATHGSAASGFLAFASLDHTSDPVDESSVLVYPEDIEKMAVAPALVVLSSCDSGRGTVKADGVLGMARAFILAGAQAVMTTLWRVPDESAAVFMKFFYQYLVDGHPASISLQKAILSIRSFSKYSGFVHWSGYQLTGREVAIVRAEGEERERAVKTAMGGDSPTVFPRLDVVQSLEKELIEKWSGESNPPPTDVQVVHGSHGLRPAGPVRDFILRNHAFFTGGIFWLNGTTTDYLNGGLELVKSVSAKETADCVLVVVDGIKSLPKSDALLQLIKSRSTRIIVISHTSQPPETLRKEIDQQLIRGCSPLTIQPLSTVHTTQRIVHTIMSHTHFTPLNREQRLLEKIAGLTSGCPGLVQVTNALLQHCIEETEKIENSSKFDFLDQFTSRISLLADQRHTSHVDPSPSSVPSGDVAMARSRAGSFVTDSYTSELITAFQLPPAHEFVLRTLSVFSPLPIPLSVTDIVQRLVVKATQGSTGPGRGAPNSITNLLSAQLLCSYPSPIVRLPDTNSPTRSPIRQEKFMFVPQLVQDALWEQMEDTDKAFAITTAYKALLEFVQRPELSDSDLCCATGLAEAVVARCDTDRACIDDQVYKEAYKLLVSLQLRRIEQPAL